jgi:uncharacterized protein YjbJ (UPF0337 family)
MQGGDLNMGSVDLCCSTARGKQMNPRMHDEITKSMYEVKGKVKEKAGRVMGDPELGSEGDAEYHLGKVEKKVG